MSAVVVCISCIAVADVEKSYDLVFERKAQRQRHNFSFLACQLLPSSSSLSLVYVVFADGV